MNILFSTTRHWNPGDELINRGIDQLLRFSGYQFNSIVWNRHPSIRPGHTSLDNSFDEFRYDPKSIDYVIFAGSPEWLGPRVDPLYQLIQRNGLRCSLIGIGSHGEKFGLSPVVKRVLQHHTDLIICRDQSTFSRLTGKFSIPHAQLMPCPALFHCVSPIRRLNLQKVAVIYQSTYTPFQSVNIKTRDFLIRLINELSPQISVQVICHYIDEALEASAIFGSERVRFSSDAADYENYFKEVDLVVGARIHGCLGAISCGTPAMLLEWGSDLRRKGVADEIPLLSLGQLDSVSTLIQQILSFDVAQQSARIGEWRIPVQSEYQRLLQNHIAIRPHAELQPEDDHERIQQVLRNHQLRCQQAPNHRRAQRLKHVFQIVKNQVTARIRRLFPEKPLQ